MSMKRFCSTPQKSIWGERRKSANFTRRRQVLQSKFTPGCDEDSLSDEAEDANAEDTDDHSSSQSSEDLMAVEDNL